MKDRAFYLRDCGWSIPEIARELGLAQSTVGGWLRGYGPFGVPTELPLESGAGWGHLHSDLPWRYARFTYLRSPEREP